MIFRGFRAFAVGDVTKFIRGELTATLKDLFAGLLRLDFIENFSSFEETLELANGQEVSIVNKLNDAPTKRIIVRQTGNAVISDGTGAWDTEKVTLKNEGPDRAKITVIFMR